MKNLNNILFLPIKSEIMKLKLTDNYKPIEQLSMQTLCENVT